MHWSDQHTIAWEKVNTELLSISAKRWDLVTRTSEGEFGYADKLDFMGEKRPCWKHYEAEMDRLFEEAGYDYETLTNKHIRKLC